jgi:methylglutaconyl-CoA hydratase
MEQYSTIEITRQDASATVTLNRTDVHNAMNIKMIRELTEAFQQLYADPGIRVILLNAAGVNFSAGADLQWMREGILQDKSQLYAESLELAGLFRLIAEGLPVIVTAVRGKAIGGAVGLVAASDLAIAEYSAVFRFSEVKLGLIPATIAPFVLRRTGTSRAADWMLTGREFGADEAREAGLVQYICPDGKLEEESISLLKNLLSGGPGALREVKKLLRRLSQARDPDDIQSETAGLITDLRTSGEGQEGIRAFFEKRKPRWTDE